MQSESPEELELLDAPNETLSVEYKVALDLSQKINKAKLARHIAAMSNYGGGRIVFGFNDDLTPADDSLIQSISRDDVAAIVKHYLEPPIQCDIRIGLSSRGQRHPIILVPPHGSAPICARADGPQDMKGRVQEIKAGTYYIRKVGPASEAITTAADWTPIIRRCVLQDRSAILGAIDVAMRGSPAQSTIVDRVRRWHELARDEYTDAARAANRKHLADWHFQLSFGIDYAGGRLDPGQLLGLIEQLDNEVNAIAYSGWGVFIVLRRDGMTPLLKTSEKICQGEEEFLECNLVPAPTYTQASDFWRVSSDGIATLLRGYFEDRVPQIGAERIEAGETIILRSQVHELGRFVLFARALATRLPEATSVTFLCEWCGLAGRKAFDPSGTWILDGRAAHDGRRVASETFPLGQLSANLPSVVAQLAAPLTRLFQQDRMMDANWVTRAFPSIR